jgi:hypothetical protein
MSAELEQLVKDLIADPNHFKSGDGYTIMAKLLRSGVDGGAIKQALRQRSEYAGDLLWTICEQKETHAYVDEALVHIDDADVGTACYAAEVVLRGENIATTRGAGIQAVFGLVSSAHDTFVDSAASTLWHEGFGRLIEVVGVLGDEELVRDVRYLSRSVDEAPLTGLLSSKDRKRQVVGVACAAIRAEKNEAVAELLSNAGEPWIREFSVLVSSIAASDRRTRERKAQSEP